MIQDVEGFFIPEIDASFCLSCGVCLQRCPIANSSEGTVSAAVKTAPEVYAGWNLDEKTRSISTSGGVFTALASAILNKGGIVVGAAYDCDLKVRHVIIESLAELYRLHGSKYVQSEVTQPVFDAVLNHLRQEKYVLFSGTPCQVAGLQAFLGKDFNRLLCCDILCIGVPSPQYFASYVNSLMEYTNKKITTFFFRDKTKGWKQHSISFLDMCGEKFYLRGEKTSYSWAFSRCLSFRESCYRCKFSCIPRRGDISLGDFWKVGLAYPDYDMEDKGTSLVLVNTTKGKSLLHDSAGSLFLGGATLEVAKTGNPCLIGPFKRPQQRNQFYNDLKKLTAKAFVDKYKLRPLKFRERIYSGIGRRLKWWYDCLRG